MSRKMRSRQNNSPYFEVRTWIWYLLRLDPLTCQWDPCTTHVHSEESTLEDTEIRVGFSSVASLTEELCRVSRSLMPLPTLRCIFWCTLWHFTNRSPPKHRIPSQLLRFLMCKPPSRAISMHRHDKGKGKAKSFFCRVRGLEPCFFIWLQMTHLPDFVSTCLDIN